MAASKNKNRKDLLWTTGKSKPRQCRILTWLHFPNSREQRKKGLERFLTCAQKYEVTLQIVIWIFLTVDTWKNFSVPISVQLQFLTQHNKTCDTYSSTLRVLLQLCAKKSREGRTFSLLALHGAREDLFLLNSIIFVLVLPYGIFITIPMFVL